MEKNSKESSEGISPFHRTQITTNRYIAMINEKIDKISDLALAFVCFHLPFSCT